MKLIMDNRGATLVELLVAASIMVVMVFAVLAVIRVGSEIEVADNHRRVARSHISSWFEENFTAGKYTTYATMANIENSIFIKGTSEKGEDVTLFSLPDGTGKLTGEFTIELVSSARSIEVIPTPPAVSVATVNIPYISAAATISWKEHGGNDESIVLTKMITNLGTAQ